MSDRGVRLAWRAVGAVLVIPGVLLLVWGALAAGVSFLPGAEVDAFGSDRPIAGFAAGLLAIVAGGALLALPRRLRRRAVRIDADRTPSTTPGASS